MSRRTRWTYAAAGLCCAALGMGCASSDLAPAKTEQVATQVGALTACTTSAQCGGETCCNGFCVKLAWDSLHCGSCGNACGSLQGCCGGSCAVRIATTDPPPESNDLVTGVGTCLRYYRYKNQGQAANGNIVPDFSFAGYRGGGVPIPTPQALIVLSPLPVTSGDDRPRIQAAIDDISDNPLNAAGFRGAVLLRAGKYRITAPGLQIRASGVVLRGEGQGPAGTLLTGTTLAQYSVISATGGDPAFSLVPNTTTAIVGDVLVGATEVVVSNASFFAVGDEIVVRRRPNEQFFIDHNPADGGPWTADRSEFEFGHRRVVRAKNGNKLTFDIPIMDSIESTYAVGDVAKVAPGSSTALQQVGVENLRIQALIPSSQPEDEAHAWEGVRLSGVENSWVRKITALYVGGSAVMVTGTSRFVTVEDAAHLDPISKIEGGRRYPFRVMEATQVLFQRVYARKARHSFVTTDPDSSNLVWLDAVTDEAYADDGPHGGWSTGLLFDNVQSKHLSASRHNNDKQGFAGAQVMFWNSEASSEFIVDAPLGGMNYGVGCVGNLIDNSKRPSDPFGIWSFPGIPRTYVRSLYLRQLRDRKGQAAVDAVATPNQRTGRIWDAIRAWAGNGPPPSSF